MKFDIYVMNEIGEIVEIEEASSEEEALKKAREWKAQGYYPKIWVILNGRAIPVSMQRLENPEDLKNYINYFLSEDDEYEEDWGEREDDSVDWEEEDATIYDDFDLWRFGLDEDDEEDDLGDEEEW